MFQDIALSAVGLVLLFLGGDALVRGAVALAARLGLSPLVIGITVVGFGTSTPELLVSLQAALGGKPDIAVGNVVGSNMANILLILGAAAIISVIIIPFRDVGRDLAVMIGAAVALLAVSYDGQVSRIDGVLLAVGLVVYLALALRRPLPEAAGGPTVDADDFDRLSTSRTALFILGGLGALMAGAYLLVEGASGLARAMGITEAVIGLTVVAVGTSLPELAAALAAGYRKQSSVVVGNIVGSNIFNILAILGITAMVAPVAVAPRILALDIPLMLATSLTLLALIWWFGGAMRWAGVLLVALYAAYIVSMT